MNNHIEMLGIKAKQVSKQLAKFTVEQKNSGLISAANSLKQCSGAILKANQIDWQKAKASGMKSALLDRLALDDMRIKAMAEGLLQIGELPDPVGEVLFVKTRPNGLRIGQKRVPLGVVGIVYESRPNVTSDAFGLCFKTNNAVILRGGSDAIHTNKAIVKALQEGLEQCAMPKETVQLVEDTAREAVQDMLNLRKYIDVLIPRGGQGLISYVVENSKIPVIETGTGNCHVYVDEWADIAMAVDIIDNAKTQRLGVCNACESVVIHEKIAGEVIPLLVERLKEKGIEVRGDQAASVICKEIKEATEEDWGMEYLDAIISIKIVPDIETAIAHINTYNTGHSESIITKHYDHALQFQDEIDAAVVYVNASTRFTDGYEFGFGTEIGISTQKLHARGPMGLEALTTTKYIVSGNGQIRL